MKKIILSILLLTCFTVAFANLEPYKNDLRENIKAMEAAHTVEELQSIANIFERISVMAPKEWLPSYYASLTYIKMSIFEQSNDKKESSIEKAKPFLEKTIKLAPEESEVLLLEGYWNMMKLTIDPMTRSQTLGPVAQEFINRAQAKNPDNPRVFLLKGHMEYGTATFFKKPVDGACDLFRKSKELHERSKPEDLAPDWGRGETAYMLSNCK